MTNSYKSSYERYLEKIFEEEQAAAEAHRKQLYDGKIVRSEIFHSHLAGKLTESEMRARLAGDKNYRNNRNRVERQLIIRDDKELALIKSNILAYYNVSGEDLSTVKQDRRVTPASNMFIWLLYESKQYKIVSISIITNRSNASIFRLSRRFKHILNSADGGKAERKIRQDYAVITERINAAKLSEGIDTISRKTEQIRRTERLPYAQQLERNRANQRKFQEKVRFEKHKNYLGDGVYKCVDCGEEFIRTGYFGRKSLTYCSKCSNGQKGGVM